MIQKKKLTGYFDTGTVIQKRKLTLYFDTGVHVKKITPTFYFNLPCKIYEYFQIGNCLTHRESKITEYFKIYSIHSRSEQNLPTNLVSSSSLSLSDTKELVGFDLSRSVTKTTEYFRLPNVKTTEYFNIPNLQYINNPPDMAEMPGSINRSNLEYWHPEFHILTTLKEYFRIPYKILEPRDKIHDFLPIPLRESKVPNLECRREPQFYKNFGQSKFLRPIPRVTTVQKLDPSKTVDLSTHEKYIDTLRKFNNPLKLDMSKVKAPELIKLKDYSEYPKFLDLSQKRSISFKIGNMLYSTVKSVPDPSMFANVTDLTIKHSDYGEVRWLSAVDITKLDLNKLCTFSYGTVEIDTDKFPMLKSEVLVKLKLLDIEKIQENFKLVCTYSDPAKLASKLIKKALKLGASEANFENFVWSFKVKV